MLPTSTTDRLYLAALTTLVLLAGTALPGCPSQTSGDDDDDDIADDDTQGGDDDSALTCEPGQFSGHWGGDIQASEGIFCVEMELQLLEGSTLTGTFDIDQYFENCVFLDDCTAQCDHFTTDDHPDCVDFHLVTVMTLDTASPDDLAVSLSGIACSADQEEGHGTLVRDYTCMDQF
jgi:hypothetical protein